MIRKTAAADHQSVTSLVQELVRIPTRGGIDPYDGIIDRVSEWLSDHGLAVRRLTDTSSSRAIAIVCDIHGRHSGPRYVLDACLDTAPFGDLTAWRHAPTSGVIEDGWLYGRGAADSKAAVAIFMHVARHLREDTPHMHGSLTLLFDADEHTGGFGGAKQYFREHENISEIRGVMIGYPGSGELIIGGRGFLRAEMTVRGQAGHTGSRRTADNINAVEKAAELVTILAKYRVPASIDPTLDLPPRLTVTGISGGESCSIIPDYCTVNVDVRLTTSFDENDAKNLIREAMILVDERWPLPNKPTTVEFSESWPAYRLDQDSPLRVALTRAAEHHLEDGVTAKVAGPSNIGNYLAKLGIDATAGLGVNYKGLHATDERIELATIPIIQAIYHEAVRTLLNP